MPERFEICIVYKKRYINTLPFLSFYKKPADDVTAFQSKKLYIKGLI